MFTIDTLQATDAQAFKDLLDRCFPVPAGSHYLDDFPIWGFHADPVLEGRVFRVGARSKSELVATAAVRLAHLRTPRGATVKVGVIGAVATSEQSRGRGLASELVAVAGAWAQERGACLLVLWGSELSLYQRLGFELAGAQVRVPLAAVVPTLDDGLSPSSRVGTTFCSEILELLQKRRSGLVLDASDAPWLYGHKNVKWLSVFQEGKCLAYAAYGRGIDMQNQVHEWGGDPTALRALLSQALIQEPKLELMGHPAFIAETFGPNFVPAQTAVEYLGLVRVLDPVALVRAYAPEVAIQARPLEAGWELQLGGSKIDTLSEGELSQFLLGPGAPQGGELTRFLPLPVWFWGLDAA